MLSARVSRLRWVVVLGAGAVVDCAEGDSALVPSVATVVPADFAGPGASPNDGGLAPVCTRCGRACPDDTVCAGEFCAPRADGAPKLLRPTSVARTSTQRPTLRWIPTEGSTGSLVEVCRDRACTEVLRRAERTDATWRPEAPFAPGVYFWRVRARVGTEYSEKASATWEFSVGHRDTPIDTTAGRIWDLNGDGYADVYVQMGDARDPVIYFGGPTGLATTYGLRIPARREGAVRVSASPAGDLNGDGFADVLLREFVDDRPGPQRVLTLPGGPSPALERAVELRSDEPWAANVWVGGDLDGDGYGELVGVDSERDGAPARVRVWFGTARGVEPQPRTIMVGVPGTGFGRSVSGGDLNGDGLPDMLIGAPNEGLDTGQVVAWLNGRCAQGSLLPIARGPAAGARFGQTVGLSDANGDGYADPLVTVPFSPSDVDRSAIHVFSGPADPPGAPRVLPFPRSQLEQIRPTHGGDYNGDGWNDLVVWMNNGLNGPSYLLYLGGPEGLPTQPTRVGRPADFGSRGSGLTVNPGGDINRDGYDDLMIYLDPGQAMVSYGSAEGPRLGPSPWLTLPELP